MATQNPPAHFPQSIGQAPGQGPFQGLGRSQQPRRMDTAVPVVSPMMFDYNDENFRTRAKNVAKANICTSCCCFAVMFILFLLTVLVLGVFKALGGSLDSNGSLSHQVMFDFGITEMVILSVLIFIECVVSCGLLKATKPATPANVANRKANCWQCYSVLLVFFNFNFGCLCIAVGLREHYGYLFIYGGVYLSFVVIRLIFIFLVNGFIKIVEEKDSMDPDSTMKTEDMGNNPTNQPINNPNHQPFNNPNYQPINNPYQPINNPYQQPQQS